MSQITVRNPTLGEVDKAAEIAWKAFDTPESDSWLEKFRGIAEVFGTRFILVVELDGQIVSSLMCTPGPIYVGGQSVSHSAVGAVGTLMDYRNMGLAGAMMTECVKLLRAEGLYTSSLWPFSYEYYRKFGWEVGSEVRNYCIDAKTCAGLGDASKTRGANLDDLPAIKAVYEDCAPNHNCLTQRSDEWWAYLAKMAIRLELAAEPGKGTVVHLTGGAVDGYAFYEFRIKEDKPTVDVAELMFRHPEHRRDMLAFLAGLVPDGRVGFDAPACDLFMHEIPNPRLVRATTVPSFQFRVIDPEQAILSLRADESVSGRLSFSISDPVLEEGFHFGVEIGNGRISLGKYDAGRAMEMPVQTLAKLYSGYLKPADALKLGLVRIPGDAAPILMLASRVFSPLPPYRSWLEPG